MYNTTCTLPTDKCFMVIFLTYIKVIYFRTSPTSILFISSLRSGNNSSLSSSVTLSVSYLSPSDSAMSLHCVWFERLLPLSVKTLIYYMVFPTQQQSFEVIQLSSHQCVVMEIFLGMQTLTFILIRCEKCAVTPRKDSVIPGFYQISAHILMTTALLNND